MSKVAIGYCRTMYEDSNNHPNSLENQEKEIRKYCVNNNIELKHIYVDSGVSAIEYALKDRPQGKLIIEHINNKNVDYVISQTEDRLFRLLDDSIETNNLADKNGVKLLCIK